MTFLVANSDLTDQVECPVVRDDISRHTPPAVESRPGVVELLLHDQQRLNTLLRDEHCQRELLPRLLAVAITGFAVYGVVVTAILNVWRSQSGYWLPTAPAAFWNDASVANLGLAYSLGLIAAHGICLPSFYFYGLLAGIKITMLGVAAHAVKSMAAGAVALIGFLPIYVALALTSVVFPQGAHWQSSTAAIGLALPLLAGIVGATSLYEGFVSLADTMTSRRCVSRECFLRRLILAWTGCVAFVVPVMIYSLWHFFSNLSGHVG